MLTRFLKAALPAALLTASSCAPRSSDVHQQIQAGVEQNSKAKSYDEYELSDQHPERIFESLRAREDDDKVKVELCSSLKELPVSSLQVYEEELKDDENERLLTDCRLELLERLTAHREQVREAMREQGMDTLAQTPEATAEEKIPAVEIQARKPLLPLKIEYRDVSRGYKAFTGDVADREVVLTFDDGPHKNNTPVVLSVLRQYGVKAIFFEQGSQIQTHPEMTRLVAREGHAIGNHSMTHPYMGSYESCSSDFCRRTWIPVDKAIAQIQQNHRLIYETVGFVDPFFRFPYGARVPALVQFLKDNKTAEFAWNVDSNDWNMKYTNQEVLENTMSQLNRARRGIVLFHDTVTRTAEILPQFMRLLAQGGYTVVLLQSNDVTLRTRHPLLGSQPIP
jgi:peptidoglycan/xylan/chitin deacetylase (PgdA/CDA1 family)